MRIPNIVGVSQKDPTFPNHQNVSNCWIFISKIRTQLNFLITTIIFPFVSSWLKHSQRIIQSFRLLAKIVIFLFEWIFLLTFLYIFIPFWFMIFVHCCVIWLTLLWGFFEKFHFTHQIDVSGIEILSVCCKFFFFEKSLSGPFDTFHFDQATQKNQRYKN